MAVIYRIQDKHGRGPFKPGTSMRWLDNMVKRCGVLEPWHITWPQIHPANYPHHHLACGCLTLPQLRQWFSADEYQKLKELGYARLSLSAFLLSRRKPNNAKIVITTDKTANKGIFAGKAAPSFAFKSVFLFEVGNTDEQ